VTAARQLVEALSEQGVTIFVLHDFDKAGFSILHTLRTDTRRYTFAREPNVVDLGLRLTHVEAMGLASEPVTYKGDTDPRWRLRECGATEEECDLLVRAEGVGWTGERVELNAMTSPQLVEWLEGKLAAHGVAKLVPERAVLANAYRRALRLAAVQRAIDETNAAEAEKKIPVPRDIGARVRAVLAERPAMSWDAALWEVASARGRRRGGE